jgi:predicted dehydrogenase
MGKRRIAIIGAGNIIKSHIKAIQANADRVEVVAISDLRGERVQEVCKLYDIPNGYTDSAKMIAEQKPDLVHIITPPATHKDLITMSLEAGAWVFCEKPLCRSLADFDAITKVEQQTGCYLSTVFQWRFGSAGKHMKKLIHENAFGRPLVIVCNTLWYRTQAYYNVAWRGRFENEFGGPTMTLGIHLTDFMLWMMDDWSEVSAMIGTLDHDIQVEDISMANVRFANGALASIVNSALSPRQETFLRMDFQKATIELIAMYRYMNEHWQFSTHPDLEDESIQGKWDALSEDFMGSHDQQLSEILDAMDSNTPPPVHGDEGRRILEFNASLYKSAFTGQIVTKGSITPDDPYYYSNNGAPEMMEKI